MRYLTKSSTVNAIEQIKELFNLDFNEFRGFEAYISPDIFTKENQELIKQKGRCYESYR